MNTRHHTVRSAEKGFTLIELLIVIAIVAMLAAILFPVFSRVRENARRASCASNLKQIGLGIMQYSQDYDETMVPVALEGSCYSSPAGSTVGTGGACGGNYKWMDLINPYVKSEEIFNCPSAVIKTNSVKYDYANGTRYGHYSANAAYYGAAPGYVRDNLNGMFSYYREGSAGTFAPERYSPIRLSMIEASATTVMVADARPADTPFQIFSDNYYNNTTGEAFAIRAVGADATYEPNFRTLATPGGGISERHLETTNVLWGDGHVKAVRLDALAKSRVGRPITSTNSSGVSSTVNSAGRPIFTSFTIEDD